LTRPVEAAVSHCATAGSKVRLEKSKGETVAGRCNARSEVTGRSVDGARAHPRVPGDRLVANPSVEAVRRIGRKDLGRENATGAARTRARIETDLPQRTQQRRSSTQLTRAARYDERPNFAGERRGWIDAMTIEPTLDLSARRTAEIGDEVNVSTQHGLSCPNACVLVEPGG
jgi:hypothetical protein